MDRLNVIEDPDTSVVINELSGLTINEAQVGLNHFEEKLEDVLESLLETISSKCQEGGKLSKYQVN